MVCLLIEIYSSSFVIFVFFIVMFLDLFFWKKNLLMKLFDWFLLIKKLKDVTWGAVCFFEFLTMNLWANVVFFRKSVPVFWRWWRCQQRQRPSIVGFLSVKSPEKPPKSRWYFGEFRQRHKQGRFLGGSWNGPLFQGYVPQNFFGFACKLSNRNTPLFPHMSSDRFTLLLCCISWIKNYPVIWGTTKSTSHQKDPYDCIRVWKMLMCPLQCSKILTKNQVVFFQCVKTKIRKDFVLQF